LEVLQSHVTSRSPTHSHPSLYPISSLSCSSVRASVAAPGAGEISLAPSLASPGQPVVSSLASWLSGRRFGFVGQTPAFVGLALAPGSRFPGYGVNPLPTRIALLFSWFPLSFTCNSTGGPVPFPFLAGFSPSAACECVGARRLTLVPFLPYCSD